MTVVDYRKAGVGIAAGNEAIQRIKAKVESTGGERAEWSRRAGSLQASRRPGLGGTAE